jgi:hypothetical protein
MPGTVSLQRRSIDSADEVSEVDLGRVETVTVGDMVFTRATFLPGWHWATHLKPEVGTESCDYSHRMFVAAGALHVEMDDGAAIDLVAGDVVAVDPGHDAWVTSEEPLVLYEFSTVEQL